MKRREFMAGTAALLVLPRRSCAQGTPRRIGTLNPASDNLPLRKVFRDSLRDHGWVEGRISSLIPDPPKGMPSAYRL